MTDTANPTTPTVTNDEPVVVPTASPVQDMQVTPVVPTAEVVTPVEAPVEVPVAAAPEVPAAVDTTGTPTATV